MAQKSGPKSGPSSKTYLAYIMYTLQMHFVQICFVRLHFVPPAFSPSVFFHGSRQKINSESIMNYEAFGVV